MNKLLIISLFLPIIGLSQQTFNFSHNGLNREYIYYSPADIKTSNSIKENSLLLLSAVLSFRKSNINQSLFGSKH